MAKTSNFSGTWESVSVEGLDDFLTVLKVNIIKRKMAGLATPTHAIEHEGDRFQCTIDMGFMAKVEDMTIGGGEVDSETPLGDKCLATLEWDGAVMVNTMKNEKTTIVARRWLESEDMMICEVFAERRGTNTGYNSATHTRRMKRIA